MGDETAVELWIWCALGSAASKGEQIVVIVRGIHVGLKGDTAARDINLGEFADTALSAMDEKSSRGSRTEP